jgi:hypothetical protein
MMCVVNKPEGVENKDVLFMICKFRNISRHLQAIRLNFILLYGHYDIFP